MKAILARWENVLAARRGDVAVLAPDGSSVRTFGEVAEQAARWAERLVGEPGCIAIQVGNAPEFSEILLGAWTAGAPVVPLDADLAGERRAAAEALVGASARVERRGDEIEVVSIGERTAPRGDFFKLTSGSTGAPRAVRFSAGQLLADCDQVCDSMGLRDSDRNFGVIPFGHSYGFSNLVTPLVCRGIPVIASGDPLPRAMARGLAEAGATVFPGVPAFFRALSEIDPPALAMRLCLSAGALLPTDVARRFHERWGRKIHSFYGSSECGGICYDAGDEIDLPEGFVGRPLVRVTVTPLASDEPFFIRVESAAVAEGYEPAEGDALTQGAFFPGDLLSRHGDGFVLAGRSSDFINVAGRKVNPVEIERVLQGAPGGYDVVVFGLPSGARGEEVVACVAGPPDCEPAWRAYCAGRLAPWQVPRRWIFVSEIPRNARGKVSRAALREMYS